MKLIRKAKAAVREHQRLSGAQTEVNAGGIMANKPRYYQTVVHKNIACAAAWSLLYQRDECSMVTMTSGRI